jgi:hypothetical protein
MQQIVQCAEFEQFNNSPLVVKMVLESINDGLIAFFPFKGNANDSTQISIQARQCMEPLLLTAEKDLMGAITSTSRDYIKVLIKPH